MYALNLTGRPVLITPPEVLKKTGTNNNLDSGRLLPGIEIAEIRFLQGADGLGTSYYSALAKEKNRTVDGTNIAALQAAFNAQGGPGAIPQLKVGDLVNASEFLSSVNLELWNWILWKYVAECVLYVSIPDNYVDFTSAGLVKQNPISSVMDTSAKTTVGPGLGDVKFIMDKWLRERIEPLRTALIGYLTDNGSKYPAWERSRRGAEKNSAYVDLSFYRDQDDPCGCVWKDNNPGRRPSSSCCDDPLSW